MWLFFSYASFNIDKYALVLEAGVTSTPVVDSSPKVNALPSVKINGKGTLKVNDSSPKVIALPSVKLAIILPVAFFSLAVSKFNVMVEPGTKLLLL